MARIKNSKKSSKNEEWLEGKNTIKIKCWRVRRKKETDTKNKEKEKEND